MLLFVSSDDLKQDLPQKMLLFVSSDDLKQDLPQKMLLFVRGRPMTKAQADDQGAGR